MLEDETPPTPEQEQALRFALRLRETRPWGTRLLIAACVGVFIASTLAGGSTRIDVLMRFGANYSPYVRGGEWWRLYGSTFLHIGLLHLVANMYALYQVGTPLERMLGNFAYLALYAVAGLCGSLASTWYHAAQPSVAAGASGAIFGVVGGLLYAVWRSPLPGEVRRRMLSSLATAVIVNLALGATVGLDNAAHLGGLVSGTLFAALLTSRLFQTVSHEAIVQVLFLIVAVVPFGTEGYVLWRAAQDVSVAQSPTLTYVDPQGRFRVRYSEILQADEVPDGVQFTSDELNFSVLARPAREATEGVRELRKYMPVEREEKRTVAGREWLLLWSSRSGAEQSRMRFAILEAGPQTYILRLRAPDADFEVASRGFDAFVASFQPVQ